MSQVYGTPITLYTLYTLYEIGSSDHNIVLVMRQLATFFYYFERGLKFMRSKEFIVDTDGNTSAPPPRIHLFCPVFFFFFRSFPTVM